MMQKTIEVNFIILIADLIICGVIFIWLSPITPTHAVPRPHGCRFANTLPNGAQADMVRRIGADWRRNPCDSGTSAPLDRVLWIDAPNASRPALASLVGTLDQMAIMSVGSLLFRRHIV